MEPQAHSDCVPRIASTAVLLQDLQPVAECSSGRIGVVCPQTADVFPIGQPLYLKKSVWACWDLSCKPRCPVVDRCFRPRWRRHIHEESSFIVGKEFEMITRVLQRYTAQPNELASQGSIVRYHRHPYRQYAPCSERNSSIVSPYQSRSENSPRV